MALLLNDRPAPGGPGITPHWARSNKDVVGTAYSGLSGVWFTISAGTLNEVYYPRVDRPQTRDWQFLVSDGSTFVLGERELQATYEHLGDRTLGFAITLKDPEGRFQLFKEVITHPYHPCLLVKVRLEANAELMPKLRLFALLAPHLEVGGAGNIGNVVRAGGRSVLTAHKGSTWLVLGGDAPFARCSCGYVGVNDGWRDLKANRRMTYEFDSVGPGNIALTAEVDLSGGKPAVLGLAFGDSLTHALVNWTQAMVTPFDDHKAVFVRKWQQTGAGAAKNFAEKTGDGGRLARLSTSLILAHEDKRFEGAMIASLSIPWGEARDEDEVGGYHLVWTRDLCHSAIGLLAAGEKETPLRALIYLSCVQRPDGGFYQNFWIDGRAYWQGIQLDETAFPILLAWHLRREGALKAFDPYPLVKRAAGYLVRSGPVTPQERWEENSGFSPSTLAAVIAGLICAASFAREHGDEVDAAFLEGYADFLESMIERWTVTDEGSLLAGVPRYYVRICPADPGDPRPAADPNRAVVDLRNQEPGAQTQFAAKDVVDGGFLELVRYGIRRADDPVIVDTVKVVDAVLAVDVPGGRCWRRYNHDGYGQRADGGPFVTWGYGHAWPVLTGERGHYELAASRDPTPSMRTMEALATSTALLPEQVWMLKDLPAKHMYFGRPTGGATPLVWAHGEYLRLVRSAADGRVFDLIPEVAERYQKRRPASAAAVWMFRFQTATVRAGGTLRVQAEAAFRLRWTVDGWKNANDTEATKTDFGVWFADVKAPKEPKAAVEFTFYWTESQKWEGTNFRVEVEGS